MKTILSAFAMVAIFASCNSNPSMGDQSGKKIIQNDVATSNRFTDKPQYLETEAVIDEVDQNSKTTSGSYREGDKVVRYEVQKPIVKSKPVAKSKGGTVAKKPSVSTNSGAGNQTASAPVPQATKKKGWSKAAKGTAIGAGSGAILGAVISKKKGKGAIIGGVLGAGAGYAIGRAKDKKEGRY